MGDFTARINSRSEVAEDTCEITLRIENEDFKFIAGQYVEVSIPDLQYEDSKGNSRKFSIASSPHDPQTITVTFRSSQSGFKRTLIELPVESEVRMRGPFGAFTLPEKDTNPLVFIAGGVGITPFMSMLRTMAKEGFNIDTTVLYANSRPERAMYMDELIALEKAHPHFAVKRKYGDVDTDFITKSVAKLSGKKWYIAGPPAMVYASRRLLHELGITESNILAEEMTGYKGGVHMASLPRILHKFKKRKRFRDRSDPDASDHMTGPVLEVLEKLALVSVTDVEGIIVHANDLFVEISRYSREELIGQNHRILKSGYHPPSFYKELWSTISGGKKWRGQIKNKTKDGASYWVDTSILPVFGADGEIVNYIAVHFPINKQKEAEEKLHSRTAELTQLVKGSEEKTVELEKMKKATLNLLEDIEEEKSVVEQRVLERTEELEQEKEKLLQVTRNMRGGAILLDEKQNVIFTNSNTWHMLGVNVNEIKNDRILDLFFKKFEDTDIRGYFDRCIHGETFNVPDISGGERIYEIFFHYLEDHAHDEKKLFGYFILLSDITDTKLLERSKSELVAVASHQLRTPLTAMRGNVEMLIDESYGELNKEQHELLDDINISTIRLITMVNDMLDITKIEKGDLDITLEKFNIKEVVDSVLEDLSDYARRHEFTFALHELSGPPIVYADKSRVRQMLQNLVDNAIKYSRYPGTLEISFNMSDKNIEIILKDNGIGVPKAEQSKLFGRFYRASNTAKSTSSGSGLGLFIVKSIVNQLGGDIRFESEENIGTTFYLTLPTDDIIST